MPIVRVSFVYRGWPIIVVDESKLHRGQLASGCCSFKGTCKFQGVNLAQDSDLEDMCMGTFPNVLEEFHLLGTLKVKAPAWDRRSAGAAPSRRQTQASLDTWRSG